MYRGCLTDTMDSRLLCEVGRGKCIRCKEHGCNDQPVTKKPELSCIKCNDSMECTFGLNTNNSESCVSPVPFTRDESCYTLTYENGNVERGCTIDANSSRYWCAETEGCEYCYEDGCNTDKIAPSSCLQCQSAYDGGCARLDEPVEFVDECENLSDTPYEYKDRGCFTIKQGIVYTNLHSNFIIRK